METAIYHYQGQWLGIAERDGWEFATRVNARAVVVLVPVTDAGELVLVEQFRIPVQRRVLELPAGLVGDGDDPDETMEAAAARELLEETGYRPARLVHLLDCPSTAGLSDEMITFFLATRLQAEGPGGGDDSENLQVHHLPLETADGWLDTRRSAGVLLDPKIYTALYWLRCDPRFSAPATTG